MQQYSKNHIVTYKQWYTVKINRVPHQMKVSDNNMIITNYEQLLKYLSDNNLFICFDSIGDNILCDNLIGVLDKYGLYQVGDTVYYYEFES